MKKFLKNLSIIAAALTFTSCSNSVEIKELGANQEMKFTVTAASSSRAWEIYSNNNKPDAIKVTAYNSANGKAYFLNQTYVKDGNLYTEEGSTRYWPQEDLTLKFYSLSANNLVSKLGSTGVIIYMTEPNCNTTTPYIRFEKYIKNAAEQEDLLYAYTEASKPTSASTGTPINFRHAFSMVAFKASNNMGKVQIKIDEIRLGYYATKGTFKFPTKSTSGDASDAETVGEWGKSSYQIPGTSPGFGDTDWWIDSYKPEDLMYTKLPHTIVLNPGESSNLTYTENSVPEQNPEYGYPFILMPYYSPAWTPEKGKLPWNQIPAQYFGGYLMVKCSIQNISDDADGATPNENDAFVYGTKNETKFALIPLAYDHKPGKKYIYTLNFNGNGNNAYDSEDVNPIAVPVNLSVTVDDFTDAKNTDLER